MLDWYSQTRWAKEDGLFRICKHSQYLKKKQKNNKKHLELNCLNCLSKVDISIKLKFMHRIRSGGERKEAWAFIILKLNSIGASPILCALFFVYAATTTHLAEVEVPQESPAPFLLPHYHLHRLPSTTFSNKFCWAVFFITSKSSICQPSTWEKSSASTVSRTLTRRTPLPIRVHNVSVIEIPLLIYCSQ